MSKPKCYQKCAYKGSVPGSAHSSCKFDWTKSELKPPMAHKAGIEKGWYRFPVNFDPVWQLEECKAFNTEADPKMVREFSPMEQIFGMLK